MQIKRFLWLVGCISFAAGIVLAQAQNVPRKVVSAEFFKIVEGKAAEYRALEEKWKAEIHEDRVRKGQIESWSLYMVAQPGMSQAREYDTITLTVFDTFDKMETLFDATQRDKLRSMPSAEALRKTARRELWSLYHTAGEELLAKNFAMVYFHRTRPGKFAEHAKSLRDWKEINEQLMKTGVRQGWQAFSLMFPRGSGLPYNVVTFDHFDKFGAVAGNTVQGIEATRMSEVMKFSNEARETVRGEYWRLVDRTGKR
jgi:hypothetical protein